ncbi:MAG: modification methylase [Spirochaetes bacterium GWF1_49_6]|nr:MAG: modification methylase [Spirochaetes bacterium GWF1_49_6]
MNFIHLESEQKLRGGYYTPHSLAIFISKFVIGCKVENILEPSCGDGVFIKALNDMKPSNSINVIAIEIDEIEARKAKALKTDKINASIINDDYLDWSISRLNSPDFFDAVIGNPPFIRYQYLDDKQQKKAKMIFEFFQLPFTMHTNAWVPFVLLSIYFLKPNGYFAMILPSEILNVIHAQSLRDYLSENCKQILIIDPEEIWFENTLQGAVLLIAQKKENINEKTKGLSIIQTKGNSFLELDPLALFNNAQYINGRTTQGKWTKALLSKSELALYFEVINNPSISQFKSIANVDVGIVTGANNYFLVSKSTIDKYNLSKWIYPMFGRSEHCPGIIYNFDQHTKNINNDTPAYFLWFNVPNDSELDESAKEYIKLGEMSKINDRYKCRVRKPWYKVPSVYTTNIGLLKRSHETPRLIYNELNAYTTDTAYRIKTKSIEPQKLVYLFLNPITSLSAEIEGRHYGGGVLELVPSEIEKILIPIVDTIVNLDELDIFYKAHSVEELLYKQGTIIFQKLNLSKYTLELLINSWIKLKNHRHRKN